MLNFLGNANLPVFFYQYSSKKEAQKVKKQSDELNEYKVEACQLSSNLDLIV